MQWDDIVNDPKKLYWPGLISVPLDKDEKEHLATHISDPTLRFDSLSIPVLLDWRRRKYNIPLLAFRKQAQYDRVHIWQIDEYEGGVIPGTSLHLPESVKKRQTESTPRGIIISAGPLALDRLRTNGMDLGHVVGIVRLAPWRSPIGFNKDYREDSLLVCRDSDVVNSEDAAKLVSLGLLEFERTPSGKTAVVNHITGERFDAVDPETSSDF